MPLEPLSDPSRRQALALALFLLPGLGFATWLFLGGVNSIAVGDEPLTRVERLFDPSTRRGAWRYSTPS